MLKSASTVDVFSHSCVFCVEIESFFSAVHGATFASFARDTSYGQAFVCFLKTLQNCYHLDGLKKIDDIPKSFYITIFKGQQFRFMVISYGNESVSARINPHFKEMCELQREVNYPSVPFQKSLLFYHKYCNKDDDGYDTPQLSFCDMCSSSNLKALFQRLNNGIPTVHSQFECDMDTFSIQCLYTYPLPVENQNNFDKEAVDEIIECCKRSKSEELKNLQPIQREPYSLHTMSFGRVHAENIHEKMDDLPEDLYPTASAKKDRKRKRELFLEGNDDMDQLKRRKMAVDVANPFTCVSFSEMNIEDHEVQEPMLLLRRLLGRLDDVVLDFEKRLKEYITATYPEYLRIQHTYKKEKFRYHTVFQTIANRRLIESSINPTEENKRRATLAHEKLKNVDKMFVDIETGVWTRPFDPIECSDPNVATLVEMKKRERELNMIIESDINVIVFRQEIAKGYDGKKRMYHDYSESKLINSVRSTADTAILTGFQAAAKKSYMRIDKLTGSVHKSICEFYKNCTRNVLHLRNTALFYQNLMDSFIITYLHGAERIHHFGVSGPGAGKSYTSKMFASNSVKGTILCMGSALPTRRTHTATNKHNHILYIIDEAPSNVLQEGSGRQSEIAIDDTNNFKQLLTEEQRTESVLKMDDSRGKKVDGKMTNINGNRVCVDISSFLRLSFTLLSNFAPRLWSASANRFAIDQNLEVGDEEELSDMIALNDVVSGTVEERAKRESFINMQRLEQIVIANFLLRISSGYYPKSAITNEISNLVSRGFIRDYKKHFKSTSQTPRKGKRLRSHQIARCMRRVFATLFLIPGSLYHWDTVIKNREETEVTLDNVMDMFAKLAFVQMEDVCDSVSMAQSETYNKLEFGFVKKMCELFNISKNEFDHELIPAIAFKRFCKNNTNQRIGFAKVQQPVRTDNTVYNPNILVCRWNKKPMFINYFVSKMGIDSTQVISILDMLKMAKTTITHDYVELHEYPHGAPEARWVWANETSGAHYVKRAEPIVVDFMTEIDEVSKEGYQLHFQIQGFHEMKEMISNPHLDLFAKILFDNLLSDSNVFDISLFDESECKSFNAVEYIKACNYKSKSISMHNAFGKGEYKSDTVVMSEIYKYLNAGERIKIEVDVNYASKFLHYEKLGLSDMEVIKLDHFNSII